MAEWVGGVGAAAAFLWGVWLYRGQLRDRVTEQASRVHVLTASSYQYSRSTTDQRVAFNVSNASTDPAYDLRVSVWPWSWAADVTGGREPESLAGVLVETLGPGVTTAEFEMTPAGLGPPPGGQGYARAPVAFYLTDVRGRRWRRTPDGQLWLHRAWVRRRLRRVTGEHWERRG